MPLTRNARSTDSSALIAPLYRVAPGSPDEPPTCTTLTGTGGTAAGGSPPQAVAASAAAAIQCVRLIAAPP